jgi:2-polyprenyl-3-methyl-5-hydroxy-6-metoxy-1,4-benzoquinol methylase
MASIDPEGLETRAMSALVDFSGKRVLEIGCGDGRLTWRYAGQAKSVLAIDTLERDVVRARRATPRALRSRVRFIVADATTYRAARGLFDVGVLSYSL